MIFSLDVCRARKGDCLLLHFGTKSRPGLAVIDGGPSQVYGKHLKPRLKEIHKARKLDRTVPLPVDLVMISHVDDDHIRGVLDLTHDLMQLQGVRAPLVKVFDFWHNSFDDVIGNDPAELLAAVRSQFGAAALQGGLPPDAVLNSSQPDEVTRAGLRVLASIAQGHRLRNDAAKLRWPLNSEFDGKLIIAGKKKRSVADGLSFTVAGPMKPEIRALQEKHDKWLEEQRKKKREGAAALAAYVDQSVPNLSSIVVLARAGGKSILLTGDARGDRILAGLELAGLLKKGKKLHVDILKVPHHGSANNVTRTFFRRITADHYVFSGNGEHGNPERETLEMLLAARGKAPFEIHLTYPVTEIDKARKADWNKQQRAEKKRKANGGKKEPRENWSAAKHGLRSLLTKSRLGKNQKVRVVDDGEPHVIDLLDPLGY